MAGVKLRVAILTVSDRSSRAERPDASGPALKQAVTDLEWQVVDYQIVPDDRESIQKVLVSWSDTNEVDIILTTGGTGFAPRDITPEATLDVIHRAAPGLAEVMRMNSLRVTPHAMLSRAVAGIRRKTIIINLPGSPKAALENLQSITAVLPHAVELLRDEPTAEEGHQKI